MSSRELEGVLFCVCVCFVLLNFAFAMLAKFCFGLDDLGTMRAFFAEFVFKDFVDSQVDKLSNVSIFELVVSYGIDTA